MASAGCLKCLSRPTASQVAPWLNSMPRTAAFSTTSSTQAAATGDMLKKQQAKAAHLKAKGAGAKRTLKIKKKIPVKTGKPPMPGERKALRKRIVLSNTNALEVLGLQDLTKETVIDESLVGSVVGLEGTTVDSLRAAEAFKTTQSWGMFRRPGLLVREESLQLAKEMVAVEENKEVLRVVIDGDKGTGKSLMLVHAMATAFLRGWVVLNIPEGIFFLPLLRSDRSKCKVSQILTDTLLAQELTTAMTPYSPIPNTKPTIYTQNDYTAAWLTRIAKSNSAILNSLELSQKHNLPIPIQSNITLLRLCELGALDPDVAWPIFQALWKELTAEGRPPVLFTLDSLQLAMQDTLYRSADFLPIHAHDFAIIKQFTDYLSGARTLPNGGAIIGATQRSHAPKNITVDLAIQQAEEKQQSRPLTAKDPFERRYDPRAEQVLSSVRVLKLAGLSKDEARGLMEYWAQSGVLRSVVDERSVAEKWALAGHGVVGEIERGALKMRI